jgi:hypothetical protein
MTRSAPSHSHTHEIIVCLHPSTLTPSFLLPPLCLPCCSPSDRRFMRSGAGRVGPPGRESRRPEPGPAVGPRRPTRLPPRYPGPGRPRSGRGRTPPSRPTSAQNRRTAPNLRRANRPTRLGGTSPGAGRPGATRPKGWGRGASDGRGRFRPRRHGPGACDRPSTRQRIGRPIPGTAIRVGVYHRDPYGDRPDSRDRRRPTTDERTCDSRRGGPYETVEGSRCARVAGPRRSDPVPRPHARHNPPSTASPPHASSANLKDRP